MDIFGRVRGLGFPFGQYVVIGSGTLEALGLRKAADVDIAVLPELYEELRVRGSLHEEERYDQVFLEGEGVTIIPRLEWEKYPTTAQEAIDTAIVINDIPFMSLEELKKFKLALGRPKDLEDIKLIDGYMAIVRGMS